MLNLFERISLLTISHYESKSLSSRIGEGID